MQVAREKGGVDGREYYEPLRSAARSKKWTHLGVLRKLKRP